MKDYGLTIHPQGVVLRSDRRYRYLDNNGEVRVSPRRGGVGRRAQVAGFSKASQRNLAMIAANADAAFKSHLTLTYHAVEVAGEDESARNERVARRAKLDLNRFLSAVRGSLGRYLWVMEFQTRGVLHFHVLCDQRLQHDRMSLAWCRATGEVGDVDAMRHAVRVQVVRNEKAARHYLGRYLGKVEQKKLPPGVEAAGRWWGRSRGMDLVVDDYIVSCQEHDDRPSLAGVRIVRTARKWLSRELGWEFRGGAFVSWGHGLTGRLRRVVRRLRELSGTPGPFPEDGLDSEGGSR